MINLNKDAPLIRELLDKFYLQLESFFNIHERNANPRNNRDKSKLQLRCENNGGTIYGQMFQYLLDNFKDIITAEPESLKSIHENMVHSLGYDENDPLQHVQFARFKTTMFNYYTTFFKSPFEENDKKITGISRGRWLTKSLDLRVCPYCNHNYTITVDNLKGKPRIRPDFDHFFSKSIYPLLALSFFNLIPICGTCNKLKGEKPVFQSPYDGTHPLPKFKLYGKNQGRDQKMVLFGLGDAFDEIHIFPEAAYTKEAPNECNVTRLALKDIYDQQIDHVSELIMKAQQYHIGSYSGMIESFKGLGKTEGDIDRIIWDRYREDHSRRPLSKLTSDILDQLNLKKY